MVWNDFFDIIHKFEINHDTVLISSRARMSSCISKTPAVTGLSFVNCGIPTYLNHSYISVLTPALRFVL